MLSKIDERNINVRSSSGYGVQLKNKNAFHSNCADVDTRSVGPSRTIPNFLWTQLYQATQPLTFILSEGFSQDLPVQKQHFTLEIVFDRES